MKKKTFKFDVELWLTNKALRTCSPAARGLWIDILALCVDGGGFLTLNGKPIDDNGLVSLLGTPKKTLLASIKELGEAGIFHVTENGLLYSSKMVKEANFSAAAKVHGKRGNVRRNKPVEMRDSRTLKHVPLAMPEVVSHNPPEAETSMAAGAVEQTNPRPVSVPVSKPALKPKAAPWWKSPAGWIRQGQQQAMSFTPGTDFDEFKFCVASRIPLGVHLDALTPMYRKMVEENVKKYEKKEGE